MSNVYVLCRNFQSWSSTNYDNTSIESICKDKSSLKKVLSDLGISISVYEFIKNGYDLDEEVSYFVEVHKLV